jgi:hypothetical protein
MEKTLRKMITRLLPEERQDTIGATVGSDTMEADGDFEQTTVGSDTMEAGGDMSRATVGSDTMEAVGD